MELPAVERLGYALDFTTITPLNISAVDSYIINARRLLTINTSDTRQVIINGIAYNVPNAILIDISSGNTTQKSDVFPSGKAVIDAFKANDSYPSLYFAVYGTPSAMLAAEKSFLSDKQYEFFTWTREVYKASVRDYASLLNETALIRGLDGLPLPFDSLKPDVVAKYETFFRDYGSHIIINTMYGGRYPLEVWALNTNSAVNNMFSTDVSVMFNGIPTSGNVNQGIKQEAQYKVFSESFQYLLTISGGKPSPNLASTAGTYQEYLNWINSVSGTPPALCSLQVVDIWTLMKTSSSSVLQSYVGPLNDAFWWLVGHPDVYKTHVTFDVQSYWGEFSLLTPSAVIIADPSDPFPTRNTIASGTRVRWEKASPYDYEWMTLSFYIINDGSPIDFSLSHSSNAGPSSLGKVMATFAGHDYLNKDLTDRFDNTLFYYKAPVNSQPDSRQMDKSRKPFYTWDEVLHNYLDELSAEKK